MTLDISVPQQQPIVLLTPKITVIGVGGAGGNAINNMIQTQLGGVNFVVANTDAQALSSSLAETKIQLGIETTKGQGAGARPEVGRESAEEALDDIANVLEGSNMVSSPPAWVAVRERGRLRCLRKWRANAIF